MLLEFWSSTKSAAQPEMRAASRPGAWLSLDELALLTEFQDDQDVYSSPYSLPGRSSPDVFLQIGRDRHGAVALMLQGGGPAAWFPAVQIEHGLRDSQLYPGCGSWGRKDVQHPCASIWQVVVTQALQQGDQGTADVTLHMAILQCDQNLAYTAADLISWHRVRHDLADENSQVSDRRELVAELLRRNTVQRGFQSEANEFKYIFNNADLQRRNSANPDEELQKCP
jgi:hypothetical protein